MKLTLAKILASEFKDGRLLKCEGIIKAIKSCNTHIMAIPKAYQKHFFANM